MLPHRKHQHLNMQAVTIVLLSLIVGVQAIEDKPSFAIHPNPQVSIDFRTLPVVITMTYLVGTNENSRFAQSFFAVNAKTGKCDDLVQAPEFSAVGIEKIADGALVAKMTVEDLVAAGASNGSLRFCHRLSAIMASTGALMTHRDTVNYYHH
jgi:hypothetical protein